MRLPPVSDLAVWSNPFWPSIVYKYTLSWEVLVKNYAQEVTPIVRFAEGRSPDANGTFGVTEAHSFNQYLE